MLSRFEFNILDAKLTLGRLLLFSYLPYHVVDEVEETCQYCEWNQAVAEGLDGFNDLCGFHVVGPFSLDIRRDFVAMFPGTTIGNVKWAAKTGPRAKVYSGADNRAPGGPVQRSRNDGDTRQPASSGLPCRRLKAARRLAGYPALLASLSQPRRGASRSQPGGRLSVEKPTTHEQCCLSKGRLPHQQRLRRIRSQDLNSTTYETSWHALVP